VENVRTCHKVTKWYGSVCCFILLVIVTTRTIKGAEVGFSYSVHRVFLKKKLVLGPKSKFQPRSKRHTTHVAGRQLPPCEWINPSVEACCMIEGWDPKHLWKRVCMQAAHEAHLQCCSRQALLSLRTELVVPSPKNNGTSTYECEVRHKFQGDSKVMRQHIAGHDLQSTDDWWGRYKVLKPEFPCMLCCIRSSHGVNPGKDTNTMDGCYMWLETKTSQPSHYCKLVQQTKPYGSLASVNKSRWMSANWKESKPPEPSSNVATVSWV